jgi:thiamine biosynthesis lipoprotein
MIAPSAHAPASEDRETIVHDEQVMGTVVSFLVGAGCPRAAWAISSACAELHRIDAMFSTFRDDSAVSRLRRGELAHGKLPFELEQVLARCSELVELTDGWFNPWAMPGGIDPSGLVKGWAVERAAAILRQAGVARAMINGGGDIACFGAKPDQPWRIGIRHPWRPDALAAIVECGDGAVATSGSYERGEHLIDPHTGLPRAALASATVIGADLGLADALATALAVAGPVLLDRVRAIGYEAHLVDWDGVEHTTPGTRLVLGGGSRNSGAVP